MRALTKRLIVAMAAPTLTLASLALASRTEAKPFDVLECGVHVPVSVTVPGCAWLATLPECAYEDGNPDGNPCVWTSPRTGLRYFTTGEEYRNDNG